MVEKTGSFTLPGEAGYEELTLKLAKKWGADVIRDSDGTVLSDEITKAGYGIYSTICIIRDHNEWAKKHMDKLQQSFLMSEPKLATGNTLEIKLLDGYFTEQFKINDSSASIKYWEVFDRTADKPVEAGGWTFNANDGTVLILQTVPFHTYTVNFLAYRIWEEISMYNHVTNSWDKEHLMPIDPRTPECREYMTSWFEQWLIAHPDTTVVRFTSMFYNFVWIWGSDLRNRNRFSDWASYDFTVSPEALDDFEKEYGYALTSEDFINKGKLHVTHMPPTKKQLDYIKFTNRFVVDYGKELVALTHKYGKKAYVFYDDSWVGVEPYSELFPEFGFDGLIKCVFSGFEVRLCAGVKVDTHELRLHPYLFPVGLGGAPTFSEGGHPDIDAKKYWISVRRALLRQTVDRLGLGGYLHLTEGYPEFNDAIEDIMNEFRKIKAMHADGGVYTLPLKVSVLHAWGKLRSWSLSGHFHETYMHDLIHINEALSGLPVDVKFINFEDIKNGVLSDTDVVINAGRAGNAWSGADGWKDADVVAALQKWVYEGGVFLGVNEPSAVDGNGNFFAMSDVLGIDYDTGAKVCHGRWAFDVDKEAADKIFTAGSTVALKDNLFLTDGKAKVLAEKNGIPVATMHDFGKGKGVYLAGFEKNNANTRMLLNLMLAAKGLDLKQNYLTDNEDAECAFYPASGKLVIINNSEKPLSTKVYTEKGEIKADLDAFETKIIEQ